MKQRGIAALPVTVGVLMVVLVIGATLAAISFSELFVSKTGKEAKIGFYDAESGARDALLKITRNAYFEEINGYSPIGCNQYDTSSECTGAGCAWDGSLPTPCQSLLKVWVVDDCIKHQTQEACQSANCTWNGASCDPKSCTDCPDGCNTYDGPICGANNIYKIVCSQMTTQSAGMRGEKKSTVKIVVEVSPRGKLTQCSWEQL